MKLPLHTPLRRTTTAFTMVEVALSLAIVAFAMVAIIGVMPTGINVQKENREDTIISQDAAFILEALRGGEASSNLTALSAGLVGHIYGVNLTTFPPTAIPNYPYSPLDIVKRLSIPSWDTSGFTTGATVAVSARFRAMSGGLGDTAGAATNLAFNYYVRAQITRFSPDPYNVAYNPLATNPYILFKAMSQAERYTRAELVRAMELLLQCNRKLVSSSLDDSLILQQTLVTIVGGRNEPGNVNPVRR